MPLSFIQSLGHCQGVALSVLRLDRAHALAPGNKWFKLKPNLALAEQQGAKVLASFGGSWSNHLHALAALGREKSWPTVGFVRGQPETLTACLGDAQRWGMELRFLSHGDYRRRHDPQFVNHLLAGLESPYLIPEGGANRAALQGCAEIAELIPEQGRDYDAVLLACGTGTTLAGLALGLDERVELIGFPVVKNAHYLQGDITAMMAEAGMERINWRLDYRASHSGFGKLSVEQASFLQDFERREGLQLDPVYTAKLFWAVEQMCRAGEFRPGQRLLLIHTGGLQGRRGFPRYYPQNSGVSVGQ